MAFYQTQLGKTLPVLWEHEEKRRKNVWFHRKLCARSETF